MAARRLGAEVRLIAGLGRDLAGAEIRAGLAREGIGLEGLTETGEAATGTAVIVVDREGRNQIAVAPGANRAGVPLTPTMSAFVSAMATFYDGRLVVTSGTNHDQFSLSGNQSDHWLGNGVEFDSSTRRDGEFCFELGGARSVPFFNEGLSGMKAGGKRRIRVLPDLGHAYDVEQPAAINAVMAEFLVELASRPVGPAS